jgi:hypothetical protein
MLDSSWDDPFQDRTVDLQTRIGVTLDKVRSKFTAHIKIQAIQFEVVPFSGGIHELETRFNELGGNILHFAKNLFLEIIVLVRVGGIEISLKLAVADLIGWFIFSILFSSLLNSVIGQMYHLIL